MLIGLLFQTLMAVAAVACCAAASRDALRDGRRVGFLLMLAGAFSFAFFLSVPRVQVELLAVAGLAIITGAALIPPADKPVSRGNFDFDSTATRRARK